MEKEKAMEKENGQESVNRDLTAIDENLDEGKVRVFVNKRKLSRGKEIIAYNVDRLIKGELEEPIDMRVTTHLNTRKMLQELEKLRVKMLTDRIAYEEQVDSFNDKIAGVAHDMKTPLATIAGYAECIQDGIDDKDYPKLIAERAAIMNEQVIELVDSIRSERMERERSNVEAYGFFAGVFKSFSLLTDSKKINYKVKAAPKVHLYIDKKKITRVCQNIVSNAVKYTKEGGKISVSFRTNGKYLIVKIKDNGSGIKKADQQFVFDKFYMADKSRSGGNSGLGLSLVKDFVEAHGGTVSLRSKVNKGTAITFMLPIVYEEMKLPSTRRFERCNRAVKLTVVSIFVIFFPFFFRLVRFFETYSIPTLLAALFLTVPFFLVFWFVDFFSILVYGKITFLAD